MHPPVVNAEDHTVSESLSTGHSALDWKKIKGENEKKKKKATQSNDEGNMQHKKAKHDAESLKLENKIFIVCGNYG